MSRETLLRRQDSRRSSRGEAPWCQLLSVLQEQVGEGEEQKARGIVKGKERKRQKGEKGKGRVM